MARARMRPDTGIWYVLHGKKGKIKIGPDKKAAEFLAKRIDVVIHGESIPVYADES